MNQLTELVDTQKHLTAECMGATKVPLYLFQWVKKLKVCLLISVYV